ncbi:MAG: hypothetical protein IJT02_00620 [Synergistaceae bacterium]|nr:hypothetical protein [Synergistaceae bacterium]
MPYDDMNDEEELSLLDIFTILWRRKGLIIFLTVVFGGAAAFYAFTAPFIYRGECRILPSGSGGASGLMAQLGGLAGLVGLPSTATNGQMMIGILQGDTVVDAIIDKFNLMEEYEQEIRLHARTATLKNLEVNEDTKSGIISVAFLNKDPQRASDIANAFVYELQKKVQDLSVKDAQQKREFFENQLLQAQQELNTAEADMMKYQQDSGVIELGSQTGAILASINSLRNRIAAKNVEISTLSSYARKDNPRLKLLQSELEAMTKELRSLEEQQSRQGRSSNSDLLASVGQVPELGIEYQRYMRNLQFATAKYELMMRQYESARLSEASDISTIQIVDPATPPDYKYKPKRATITLAGGLGGMLLGVFWAFLTEHINELRKTRRQRDDDDDDY